MLRQRCCRSVYQNYQGFQAWQQIPQQSHWNMLTKLNSNLNNYQNKYKKYMNVKENQFKQVYKGFLNDEVRENKDIPFLPNIKNNTTCNSVLKSQEMNKVKVIQEQSQLRDSQIFCQRSHNHLKLKTISFQKQKKKKCPLQRRKLSLHQNNQLHIQKFFNKENEQLDVFEHSQKLSKLKSLQCKQLKYRFKKAAKKAKIFQQEWQNKLKQNLQHLNLKRQIKQNLGLKKIKNLSSIMQQIDKQKMDLRSNEFSDKKFYEQYTKIRQKFPMKRQQHSKLEQQFPKNKYKLGR